MCVRVYAIQSIQSIHACAVCGVWSWLEFVCNAAACWVFFLCVCVYSLLILYLSISLSVYLSFLSVCDHHCARVYPIIYIYLCACVILLFLVVVVGGI